MPSIFSEQTVVNSKNISNKSKLAVRARSSVCVCVCVLQKKEKKRENEQYDESRVAEEKDEVELFTEFIVSFIFSPVTANMKWEKRELAHTSKKHSRSQEDKRFLSWGIRNYFYWSFTYVSQKSALMFPEGSRKHFCEQLACLGPDEENCLPWAMQ